MLLPLWHATTLQGRPRGPGDLPKSHSWQVAEPGFKCQSGPRPMFLPPVSVDLDEFSRCQIGSELQVVFRYSIMLILFLAGSKGESNHKGRAAW